MDGGTCAVAVLTDLPPFTDAATKAGDRGVDRSRPEPQPRHTVVIPQPELLVSAAGARWTESESRLSADLFRPSWLCRRAAQHPRRTVLLAASKVGSGA